MKSNEKNYIRRLKNKKEDALEFVVDMYLPLIKSAVYKVLSSLKKDGLIEECINDVFLSIWNNSSKFKGEEDDFKKWIYKISKYKAIDYYRKECNKNTQEIDENMYSSNDTVEQNLINKENRKEALNLINKLEETDRKIFIMKFFLGDKSEAIAQKLNLTRSAIDNRVYRAKKKLYKDADIIREANL
ncbi:sigma-70 family RNA polymerase sigma factor [Clostridium sp. BJN0001]|uniref:sigma-70 family RNA polymerase sigma factor n=1 Tax=Clostridium sp. BJN0001 TaxID=2930219 RepID=UPI001FD55365|nr:sigma-70 family RNA polymerase sigma factor [Clostridium sp. BJN0001]